GGAQGHAHVGAGVAVGHGEDVELVDGFFISFNGSGGGEKHSPVCRTVHGNHQSITPPCVISHLIHSDGIHIDVHGLDGSTGGFCDIVFDFADDGSADGGQIDAPIDHDMQVDDDGAVLTEGDLHALAHGLPAQQMNQAVGHGAHDHALDAEAVGGGVPGDVGVDSAVHGDEPPVRR